MDGNWRTTKFNCFKAPWICWYCRRCVFGPNHGHGIATAIQQTSDDVLLVDHGSLYPALQRLERAGLISSEWGTSDNNRRARFYKLTRTGRTRLASGDQQVGDHGAGGFADSETGRGLMKLPRRVAMAISSGIGRGNPVAPRSRDASGHRPRTHARGSALRGATRNGQHDPSQGTGSRSGSAVPLRAVSPRTFATLSEACAAVPDSPPRRFFRWLWELA